jgi:hypothetical protein
MEQKYTMRENQSAYKEILENISSIKVIDTHEHMPVEEGITYTPCDFFDLLGFYTADDFLSSGISSQEWMEMMNKSTLMPRRIEIFFRFHPYIRFGTYFMAVRKSIKFLFDISEITQESIIEINEKLKLLNQKGVYEKLYKAYGIEKSLTFTIYHKQNMKTHDNNPFLYPIPTMDHVVATSRKTIEELEGQVGFKILTLEDYVECIDNLLDFYKTMNVKALKFGSGYGRILDYGQPDEQKANLVLQSIRSGVSYDFSSVKDLDDYLTDHIIRRATEFDIPVIFHVGIHAGGKNRVERAKASYLSPLIERFPDTKFVLLHVGAPYITEAIVLSKYYPNVYVDFTWLHIIDRTIAKEALNHCLEMLPINKVLGFGGDYMYIYNVIGHLQIARENIAQVLFKRVRKGEMTKEDSLAIAKAWLHDNAAKLYKLD